MMDFGGEIVQARVYGTEFAGGGKFCRNMASDCLIVLIGDYTQKQIDILISLNISILFRFLLVFF